MKRTMMWAAIAVTASCGGDSGPSISTSESNVCDEVAEVACFDMYRCCSEGEIENVLGVDEPRTEAQCRDDARTLCRRQLATLEFSVDNKHVRFDAKIMNDCLEALVVPDGSCATIQGMEPWTAECMEKAWVPLVEAGGKCDFNHECVTDTVCGSNRICTALPGNGMSCAAGQGCASGLYCDFNVGPATCRPLVAQNGTCSFTSQCEKGLFCDTSTATRTCQPLRAIGEKCTGDASCQSKDCLPGRCADDQSLCFTGADCGGRCADDNRLCSTDSTCAPGTCSNSATTCFSDAGCTASGTCVFPVKCNLTACEGEIVCAENHELVDYCGDALSELPIFPNRAAAGTTPAE